MGPAPPRSYGSPRSTAWCYACSDRRTTAPIWSTSPIQKASPIDMRAELYPVAHGGPGHLSVLARPRGGEWLPDEVQGWLTAGVDVVVSLLTPSECEELELTEEAALCRRAGMTFIAVPLAQR